MLGFMGGLATETQFNYFRNLIKTSEFSKQEKAFRTQYPAYRDTRILDQIREKEFSRLDRQGHTYLDFTGGNLYADSQIARHHGRLQNNVFGNPHSTNPTSKPITEIVDATRETILQFFKASPDEYEVIFTPNASGALKLVGESYPFSPTSSFLLLADNHNSVNGIREFARHAGASVAYAPIERDTLQIDPTHLTAALLTHKTSGNSDLFAYPAQSNFSGVKHNLLWITIAQKKGWDVLLDAAAFVPTNTLDLRVYKPNFVSISFYKIFGYPTGIGCLLARKDSLAKLRRPWFGGGTINLVSVHAKRHISRQGFEAFEDGTINYTMIPAIADGLRFISEIGMPTIQKRVTSLTSWVIEELLKLKHTNGNSLIQIYGPKRSKSRGCTVAMNFFDPSGKRIGLQVVEGLANQQMISLRTGCVCNPGCRETALDISPERMSTCFDRPFQDCIAVEQTIGMVRISTGHITTFKDVWQFVQFAKSFLNTPAHLLQARLSQ